MGEGATRGSGSGVRGWSVEGRVCSAVLSGSVVLLLVVRPKGFSAVGMVDGRSMERLSCF